MHDNGCTGLQGMVPLQRFLTKKQSNNNVTARFLGQFRSSIVMCACSAYLSIYIVIGSVYLCMCIFLCTCVCRYACICLNVCMHVCTYACVLHGCKRVHLSICVHHVCASTIARMSCKGAWHRVVRVFREYGVWV